MCLRFFPEEVRQHEPPSHPHHHLNAKRKEQKLDKRLDIPLLDNDPCYGALYNIAATVPTLEFLQSVPALLMKYDEPPPQPRDTVPARVVVVPAEDNRTVEQQRVRQRQK